MELAGAAVLLDLYECANEATAGRVAKRVFEVMLASQGGVGGE